ncbi:hypothetical protein FQ192_28300 [Pseudomonas sp. ANT_J12]|nr:hypothetical protein FQ192_28300 [Pseudomonas sp. ANT_J12]
MARELAPAGPRSGPQKQGLLRSPAGASSLATEKHFATYLHRHPDRCRSCKTRQWRLFLPPTA